MPPGMRQSVSLNSRNLNSEALRISGTSGIWTTALLRKRVGGKGHGSVADRVSFNDRSEVEERVTSAVLKTASGLSTLNNGGFSCREEQKFEDVHVEFIAH